MFQFFFSIPIVFCCGFLNNILKIHRLEFFLQLFNVQILTKFVKNQEYL